MELTFKNIRIHVFEPEENTSIKVDPWYKDPSTFTYSHVFDKPEFIQIGWIIEDDMGTRFKVTGIHSKWEKDENNNVSPILEFTVERYMRHGKQNPFML